MSVAFYGDYDTTETVNIPFNTFSSDDPSASVTITNLVAGDIEIHKDGSTTQRASDSGVSVTIDFDGVTGNHIASIDLSDNSDAGFYANGSRYQVRMEGTTVDGATINAWIGSFSIGCTLRPTTAGRTLDVETGGCAGIDWANVANPTTAVDLSGTDIQLCDTVTTLTGHTAQTGDSYSRLGAPAGASIAADIAENQVDLNTIIADTNELQTDWTNGGRLDLILDELTTQGDTNEGKLDTVITDTNELQTDWTDGGRLDLLIDAIKAKTDNLQLEATTNYIKSVPQDFEDVSIGDGDTLASGKAGEALRWLRWFIKNTWDVDDSPAPDEMNIYKDDGTTKGYCFQVYTSSNHNYRKVVACS